MKVGVLGPLEVRDGDTVVEISGARLRLLLTRLALDAPRAVPASVLVSALWGDQPPADEANALQSLVSRLRKALGTAELVQQSPAGYRLAVEPADVDVHRFDALVVAGRAALRAGDVATARDQLCDALALWRGDPAELADLGALDHTQARLARLEEQRLDAQADLIDAQLALGLAADVIADLEGLVAAYPLRERLAGQHIEALYATGRQADALASYERARALLADELGVDPSAELQALHLKVLRGEPSSAATSVRYAGLDGPGRADGPGASGRSHNLRATLTTFVGRDEQLSQIGDLLAAGRLVTIVGPGGAGKTRLANEAAAELAAQEPAGPADLATDVWLVELAPVTDPADVPQTLLGALGLRDAVLLDRTATSPRDALTRLVDALIDRSAVLVLDNCEHLIDAAAHLADQLLAQCPGLRVLATSREPLGIVGEALVVVPPLGQPDHAADAATALTFPAVQLFADRATDVDPRFAIDATAVAAVIEIVRRLDGQPLAIELAAARLRSLPVAEIALRLSDRFRLLTGGSRTAMPRHRTLRAVVEWSWDLLSEPERVLVERLAVFSGGVTAEAAAAVCAGTDLAVGDVDELLAALVDKSLLQSVATTRPGARYRMLETIREFGLERMAERGEVGRVRQAHADHFAELVATADPHLRRAEQLEWMDALNVERDNILAAVKFYGDDGQAQPALSLIILLGWYWMTIGSHGEIVTWVGFALDIPGETDPHDRLMAEAFLAINQIAWSGRDTHAEVEDGMKQLSTLSDRLAAIPPESNKLLVMLAPIVAGFTGDLERAERLTEQALRHEDPWVAAAVRTFRATTAENDGDVTMMRDDAETALAVFRELGERWGMANSLQVLGQLEMVEGNLDAAAAAYAEALELANAIGAREDSAMMRMRIADILSRLGDTGGAIDQAELARIDATAAGSPLEVIFTHLMQVEMVRAAGDLAKARLLRDEAVERLRALPDIHPIQGHGLAVILAVAAKIDMDSANLDGARRHLDDAFDMAVKTKDMPIVANVGVAVAMLAEQLDRPADAASILGAAAQLRGAEDLTQLDIVRLSGLFGGLSGGRYGADYDASRALDREAAIARIDPASLDAP